MFFVVGKISFLRKPPLRVFAFFLLYLLSLGVVQWLAKQRLSAIMRGCHILDISPDCNRGN